MVRATLCNLSATLAFLLTMGLVNVSVARDRAIGPVPAYQLLPDTVQGIIWIRSGDELVERWSRTQLAKMAEDPAVRPFFEGQREALENRFMDAGWRLNVTPEDIADYATGQIALAWLAMPGPPLKPFAMAMVVDVEDDAAINQRMLAMLDDELSRRKPSKAQLLHEGVSIVKYTMPRRADQVLPETSFYAVTAGQLLATDDEQLIKNMISRVLGKAVNGKSLAEDEVFRSGRQLLGISNVGQVEYFVRPLGVARVLRAIGGKRSNNNADLLVILQNQGFASIKCVCGEVLMGEEQVDVQHHGYVLADRPLPKSAGILDFPNKAEDGWRNVPKFVADDISSYLVTNWNSQEAFWRVQGLFDEMAGAEGVFAETINGIKSDTNGPRIDIRADVLPFLTNDIFAIADNKPGPVEVDSRRNMIALKVNNTVAMRKVLDRVMEDERDAKAVEFMGNTIWVVVHREDQEQDPLAIDFGDFNAAPVQNENNEQPWLSNWAISVYDGYLMFASHLEMIEKAILQAEQVGENGSPLTSEKDYQRIVAAIDHRFGDEPGSAWQIARNSLAYRVQYELFRAGKLRDSQSMLADLLDRLLQNNSEIKEKVPQINGANLPPFETIAPFLQPSGLKVRSTESGWEFGGLVLSSQELLPESQANQATGGTARVVNAESESRR